MKVYHLPMNQKFSTVIIGGGAAGFFAALAAKRVAPKKSVVILEKNQAFLAKVKISGGGRCNVTHACFEPKLLVQNYPRGHKELLGPFCRFQPKDTIEWFKERGVDLKREDDGRMFPTTDSSETIIQCLMGEAKKIGVEVLTGQKIESIEKNEMNGFHLKYKDQKVISCDKLILATGSSAQGHLWAQNLGHSIKPCVPSLFTFNIPQFDLSDLSGIAFQEASVKIQGSSLVQKGPLLITHFGLSGPAVLKLSAWAARLLHEKQYEFEVKINWIPSLNSEQAANKLLELKKETSDKTLFSQNPFNLPKKFWKRMLVLTHQIEEKRVRDISDKDLRALAEKLTSYLLQIKGKTTHKEEFVTCGGISLREVDFKTMQSKVSEGLYFAGEILDIDGITGGFNFQNAWTTGYIAGIS